MRVLEILEEASDYEIYNYEKLDNILYRLCKLVVEGQKSDPTNYGKVAAAVLDPNNNIVTATSTPVKNKWSHAERNAINKYTEQYGEIPSGSIIITTLSPCNEQEDKTAKETFSISCTDLINNNNIKKVYCGFIDPTQTKDQRDFTQLETENSSIRDLCKKFASTFLKLDENFADGKNPGRKGLAKRSSVNCKASVSTLRNVAKHSSGEKQRMAHWCANMKSGRK